MLAKCHGVVSALDRPVAVAVDCVYPYTPSKNLQELSGDADLHNRCWMASALQCLVHQRNLFQLAQHACIMHPGVAWSDPQIQRGEQVAILMQMMASEMYAGGVDLKERVTALMRQMIDPKEAISNTRDMEMPLFRMREALLHFCVACDPRNPQLHHYLSAGHASVVVSAEIFLARGTNVVLADVLEETCLYNDLSYIPTVMDIDVATRNSLSSTTLYYQPSAVIFWLHGRRVQYRVTHTVQYRDVHYTVAISDGQGWTLLNSHVSNATLETRGVKKLGEYLEDTTSTHIFLEFVKEL